LQDDSTPRRGRPPTATSHPLGSQIRQRRIARNWSIERLAEEVGLGAGSMSVISRIERGDMAPSLDVAQKLAALLDLPASPLIDWATQSRHVLYSRKVQQDRTKEWQQLTPPSIEWALGPARIPMHRQLSAEDGAPVYDVGVDPGRHDVRPKGFIAWADMRESLSASTLRALVDPFVLLFSDADFERLRRPTYGTSRPTYALVTRQPVQTIDPQEPYVVRRHSRVLLAYVGWDGHELFILPPPGKSHLRRVPAEGREGLQKRIVGQVLAMLGWDRQPVA
jgi:transcriptional regulator with XRE-family HTH domain